MVKKLIYQTFQELLDKTPSFSTKFHQAKKGGGATPDEIVNWFKKNKPEKLESIMNTNIIKAREKYSQAKTSFKVAEKNKNPEKKIKSLVEKAKDFQKGGSVDKPLGAGG
jgi:hypothetical protein